jgi:hypothetical protein
VRKDKENGQDNSNNKNEENLTQDQLIAEINKLNAEIQALKNNKNLGDSEKQTKLANLTEKLNKLKKQKSKSEANQNQNTKSDNNFPAGLVIGGVVLLVVGGLVAVLIIRNKKKRKKSY